ncbi:MAG: MBL fold metallo-hydrolase, partial [Planctomycetales bacterium]|nr:MBL fold metallo-hydrolase [Planctomycetales bacterium]
DHAVPLYCEPPVEDRIRKAYDYAFTDLAPTHPGATPKLEFKTIGTEPFEVLGATVYPLRLKHGPRFEVLGFRIGNIAYCTDTNLIPDESLSVLDGVEILILDALRTNPHPTHYSLGEAVEVALRIKPKLTFLTHLSHEFDYEATNKKLPANIDLAYDGLRLRLELDQT